MDGLALIRLAGLEAAKRLDGDFAPGLYNLVRGRWWEYCTADIEICYPPMPNVAKRTLPDSLYDVVAALFSQDVARMVFQFSGHGCFTAVDGGAVPHDVYNNWYPTYVINYVKNVFNRIRHIGQSN